MNDRVNDNYFANVLHDISQQKGTREWELIA